VSLGGLEQTGAAKCDTQCELQNPRVIRSLNAARAWRISS